MAEAPDPPDERVVVRRLRRCDQLGSAVRAVRRERGLTQAGAAALAGVSRKWLSDVENGKSGAEVGLLLRLLDVLGYEVELHPVPVAEFDLNAYLETFRNTGEAL